MNVSREKFTRNLILNQLIYFSIIWFAQSLIFYWILLFPFKNSNTIVIISKVIIVLSILIAVMLLLLKKLKFGTKKLFAIFPIFLLFQFYFKIKQNSWDDLAYHIPVELMIRDSGSLWHWPDVIYAQWGLIGGDASNALYAIAFNEFQFDRLNSLLAFIILILFAFTFKSLRAKVLAIIMFLSVPAILQQVGSRYVDALLAWALFVAFILIWSQKKANSLSRLSIFLIFISLAFSLSIKYSAIIPVLLLCICLYFRSSTKIISIATTSAGAFIVAVGPIWIRNNILHSNFLFPNYLTDESTGYMRFSSTSDILNSIYKNSIGMSNKSDLILFFYQYIVSPFETSFFLIQQLLFNNVADFQQIYYKVFTYDNRLGGFGPAVVLLILLIFTKYGLKSFPILLILFLVTSRLPVIIHPRYHLIIFVILVFFAVKDNKNNSTNKYLSLFLVGIMSMVTLFAVANINEYFKRISAPSNFSQGAQIINPDCLDVIKLGSDIWFGANLWGPSYCGKVLYGSFVYNREIRLNALGTGIEVPKQPFLKRDEIANIVEKIDSNDKITLVVCSSPGLKSISVNRLTLLEPCDQLMRHLDQEKYRIMTGKIFEETLDGPLLQILNITKIF